MSDKLFQQFLLNGGALLKDTTNPYEVARWVAAGRTHVRVDHPQHNLHGRPIGKIVDGRLDIHNKNTSEVDRGDYANPGLYHVAVRVKKLGL